MPLFKRKPKAILNIPKLIGNVQPQLLASFVGVALDDGIAVNFWATKAGDAIAISVYKDGEKETFYASSSEDMDNVLNELVTLILS